MPGEPAFRMEQSSLAACRRRRRGSRAPAVAQRAREKRSDRVRVRGGGRHPSQPPGDGSARRRAAFLAGFHVGIPEKTHRPCPSLAERNNAACIAKRLAEQLDSRRVDYAVGGAIALGSFGCARGTIDVDLTLYLPAERPSECVWLLEDLGCELQAA